MTREEANEILEDWNLCHYTPSREAAEAVISALDPLEIISALRPVSREQVEKVWRGEWNYSHTTETDHFAVVKCSKCGHEAFAIALYVKDENFCPHCGAPMTDEAVQMVMERL
ncbi:MAG: hypothetical protein ACLTAZ_07485 [Dysosmobacter welbionis]|uniref:hypothetical protein n=1 Tax=Dysosmobacter welbionis TaxID=2093857 RepID=UPI0039968C21